MCFPDVKIERNDFAGVVTFGLTMVWSQQSQVLHRMNDCLGFMVECDDIMIDCVFGQTRHGISHSSFTTSYESFAIFAIFWTSQLVNLKFLGDLGKDLRREHSAFLPIDQALKEGCR